MPGPGPPPEALAVRGSSTVEPLLRPTDMPVTRALLVTVVSAVLAGCADPPPPVAEDLLEQVTVEATDVSLGPRTAQAVVARVPRGFFANTRRPVFGRTFLEADWTAGNVAVIRYSLWERLGSGESDGPLAIGDGRFEVVGVMPEEFRIPPGVDVWIPK